MGATLRLLAGLALPVCCLAMSQSSPAGHHDSRTFVIAVSPSISLEAKAELLEHVERQAVVLSDGYVPGIDGEAFIVFRPVEADAQAHGVVGEIRGNADLFGHGVGAYVGNAAVVSEGGFEMGLLMGERVVLGDGLRYWVEHAPSVMDMHLRGWELPSTMDLDILLEDDGMQDLQLSVHFMRPGPSVVYTPPNPDQIFGQHVSSWEPAFDGSADLFLPECDPEVTLLPPTGVCVIGDLVVGEPRLLISIALLPRTGGVVECDEATLSVSWHTERCIAVHRSRHVGWHPVHYFLRHYFALYGAETCEVRMTYLEGGRFLQFDSTGLDDWGLERGAFFWVYSQLLLIADTSVGTGAEWAFHPVVRALFTNRRNDDPLRSVEEIERRQQDLWASYPQANALSMFVGEIAPGLEAFLETGDISIAMRRLNFELDSYAACAGRS